MSTNKTDSISQKDQAQEIKPNNIIKNYKIDIYNISMTYKQCAEGLSKSHQPLINHIELFAEYLSLRISICLYNLRE